MNNEKLQKAIDGLAIFDLYLVDSAANSTEGFNPKYANFDELVLQTKHIVTKSEVFDSTDDKKLFRVFVEFGGRWVDESNPDSRTDESVAQIEAEFVAEYLLTTELDQDCLDAFALRNASYHLWPYWREFFASQCERMRLPRIIFPTVQVASNRDENLIVD
ncbi:hypothetical protein [Shewanella sp. SM21]|uniref:hypothetical protein n=1 Tax=Shewanella sp. SM21 TaxID=2912793 RepID=UPI0021D7E48A|nr:hypothetical protein [Shewanella sp. SM21]MCU8089384.1 hypothetical protein [Shewanella sp. SM21]